MRSNGYLRNFSEAIEKIREDLYIPGALYPSQILSEESEEEAPELKTVFNKEWSYPKRVTGIPGSNLIPYKPWKKTSMRRSSKERIYSKLKLIPEEYQLYKETNPESYDMPQYPLYFMDGVPSFEEIPFGFGNFFHQDLGQGPDYGDWGNLVSSLTGAGTSYLESERQKYLAQVRASQAALAPRTLIPGTQSNFLIYAAIGGGLLYFLFMRKKPVSSSTKIRRKRREVY